MTMMIEMKAGKGVQSDEEPSHLEKIAPRHDRWRLRARRQKQCSGNFLRDLRY
jgi:hypothetical protein